MPICLSPTPMPTPTPPVSSYLSYSPTGAIFNTKGKQMECVQNAK